MSKNAGAVVSKAYRDAADESAKMSHNLVISAEQQQREKEIAIGEIHEMAGKVKATNFFKTQSDFFTLLMLKKVKDSKEYRDRFGMTWENFCEYVGLKRRTVDLQLEDIEPFRQDFLATFANFSGVTISKIRYLGMAIDEKLAKIAGNSIIFNGETIPVDAEHADEIKELLETLEENHKKEKDEADTTIRTKDRLLKSKEDTINKMERELKRLERTVEKSELTEEEQEGVDMLIQMQKDFLTTISDIKKKIIPHKAPDVVLRQLYYLYIFMSKVTMEERLALHEEYKNAEEVPWEISEFEIPPTDVMLDNLPMTAGKGLGKKVAEKMAERQTKNNKK
jgi:hypothetical protein